MHFLSAATALAILSFTSALPSPQPQYIPTSGNIITPTTISQYTVWTGAVDYDVTAGKIFKNGITSDITTLVTFDIPAAAAGLTCQFNFVLPNDGTATLSGTATFDVFTSLAPATESTSSWPEGNLRDQQVGRMAAYLGSNAQWVAGFPTEGQSFPCPTGQLAGELVGTGDADDIEWTTASSGPYLTYY